MVLAKSKSVRLTTHFLFIFAVSMLPLKASLAQWNTATNPDYTIPSTIQMVGNNTIYAGRNYGGIYKSTDLGVTWTFIQKQFTDTQSTQIANYDDHLLFLDENTGFSYGVGASVNFLGYYNIIFKTTDGGEHWTLVYSSFGFGGLFDMKFVSPTVGYATGYSGLIVKTTDGGQTWTALPSPTTETLYGIHFLNDQLGFVVGNGVILKTTDGGASWSVTEDEAYYRSVYFIDNDNGFAVGPNGLLKRTTDGGQTWISDESKIALAATGDYASFFKIVFTDAQTGYLASDRGLLKTVDGGHFWSLQKNTIGRAIADIDFNGSSNAVLSSIKEGSDKVLVTTTAGDPMPQNDVRFYKTNQYATDLCRGVYPVKARLINRGINHLTSADVNWSIDLASQPVFHWTGDLAPGDTTDLFDIGNYDFNKTAHDYAIAISVVNPNGQTDENITDNSGQSTFRFNKFKGIYAIGGVNPDFTYVMQAYSLLKNYGSCDSIIFNLRPGTYNEMLVLDDSPYNLMEKSLTIQSESGNPADVIINPLGNYYHAIDVNTTVPLTLRGLTITTTSTTNLSLVNLASQGNIIRFENNFLQGIAASTDMIRASIWKSGGKISIRNNQVIGGNIGIDASWGVPQSTGTMLLIDNNVFRNQNQFGIYVFDALFDIQVQRNKILTSVGTDNYTGIYVDNAQSVFTANNYVEVIKNADVRGISLSNIAQSKTLFNTVVVNTIKTGWALSLSGTHQSVAKNNNLVNYGNGGIYPLLNQNEGLILDYNNLFSKGIIGNADGSSPRSGYDLESWQAVSGFDLHSISADPQLTLNGSPHIQLSSSNYALNGAGTPVAEVTTDIDGDVRDLSHPDIGVDEFTLSQIDAGVAFETQPVYCSGSANIGIRLTNYGLTDINTATIQWDVDAVSQTPYTLSSLVKAGSFLDLNLGSVGLSNGGHEVKMHLQTPGDVIAGNDTLSTSINVGGISGTFTVGGASPTYSSISNAIQDLKTKGVCGAVTINIRSGAYNESVTIPSIPGASEFNRITFQSESLDSTSVTVTGQFTMDGAQWISIKSMTLKNLTSYSNIMIFKNGASHNTIRSNYFSGYMNTYGIYANARDYAPYIPNEYNTIEHNRFDYANGFYGLSVSWSGPNYINQISTHYEKGNSFIGNIFDVVPVTLQYQDGFTFSNNAISRGSFTATACINQNSINGNSIYGGSMDLVNFFDKGITPVTVVSNNIVASLNHTAFTLTSCNKINIYNNTFIGTGALMTVNINATSVVDEPYDQLEVKNNIIWGWGTTVCIAYNPHSQISSDYNVFYSVAEKPFAYNYSNTWGVDGQTELFNGLYEWQKKTGRDAHSLFMLPRFNSVDDFHINSDPRIKQRGVAVNLPTDIDGQPRNLSTPDIGADEFVLNVLPNDAGISTIERPSECASSTTLKGKLKNYGSNALTSATISWSVNNQLMPSTAWTGNLAPGQEMDISLGDYSFASADTFRIQAWTEMPNVTDDAESFNDTTVIFNVIQKLSGSYTIGNNSGMSMGANFVSLASAADYLNRVGVCGPVNFTLGGGVTYNEKMVLHQIDGASDVNRITFQSEPGANATIRENSWTPYPNNNSSGYFLVLMDGTDHVTFTNINFNPVGYTVAIRMQGDAHHNQFIDNNFYVENFQEANEDGSSSIYFRGAGTYDQITITGNHFENGTYGVGTGSYTFPSGLTNALIQNNSFKNLTGGIALNGPSNHVILDHNTFQTSIGNSYGDKAIAINYAEGDITVTNNNVSGIYDYGIFISQSGRKMGQPSTVANNMISSSFMDIGIQSERTYNFRYYYNSVYATNTDVNSYGIAAFASFSDTLVTVVNNSFVNAFQSPWPYQGFAYYIENLDRSTSTFDYNNVWSANDRILYDETSFTFDQYKDNKKLDAHSISVNPHYVGDNDLHALNPALDGAAIPISGITTDIDGDVRNTDHPDIGADEFVSYPADAGITSVTTPSLCQGSSDVYATIKNFGTTLLGKAKITWTLNGVPQQPITWVGGLEQSQVSSPFKVGSFTTTSTAPNTITVKVLLPNDVTDPNPSNDSTTVTGVRASLSGTYTIGGDSPDFATISDASDVLKSSGVCGPVVFLIRDGVYQEQVAISSIVGASAMNRITFQSESGDRTLVKMQHSATSAQDNFIWKLDQASYITIRNITMEASGDSINYTNVIVQNGPLMGTQILNNTIISGGYNSSMVIYGDKVFGSSIRFNEIIGGAIGIHLTQFPSADNTSSDSDSIADNRLSSQYLYGINATGRNYVIERNRIQSNNPYPPPFGAGIHIGSAEEPSMNFTVTNNIIDFVGNGIHTEQGIDVLIANNFVTVENSNGLGIPYSGIKLNHPVKHRVYFNSVSVLDGNYWSAALSIDGAPAIDPSKNEIKNNILTNSNIGMCLLVNGSLSNVASDYNDFYFTGPNFGQIGASGIDPIRYATFNAWKSITQLESNSILNDPQFTAATDLHAKATQLIGAGTPVGVTTDIDGQIRNASYPTIGADEFGTLNTVNVLTATSGNQFICNPSVPIQILVRNLGTETINSFQVQWSVNNVNQPVLTWNGSLVYRNQFTYSLPLYNFSAGDYVVKITVISPNGKTDEVPADNYTEVSFSTYEPVNLGSDIHQCAGNSDSILLDAGTFATYQWSDGSSASTLSVATAGTYSVSVTDANGCTSSDSFTLTRESLIAIVIAETDSICSGQAAFLSANIVGPSFTYQWMKDGGNISGATGRYFAAMDSGKYQVKIATLYCSSVSPEVGLAVLTKPATPTISSADPLEFCTGSYATISASAGYASYRWFNLDSINSINDSTSSIQVSETGTYWVSGISANGCVSDYSNQIAVVKHDFPLAVIEKLPGEILSCSAGDSYQWYLDGNEIDGATGQTYKPLVSGRYQVEVIKNSCATVSDSYIYLITGMENNSTGIKYYPNPVRTTLFVEATEGTTLLLYDNMGRNITPKVSYQGAHIEVDVKNLANGMYLMRLEKSGEQTQVLKVVVQK